MVHLEREGLLDDGSLRRGRCSRHASRWSLVPVDHEVTDVMVRVTQVVQHFRQCVSKTLRTGYVIWLRKKQVINKTIIYTKERNELEQDYRF